VETSRWILEHGIPVTKTLDDVAQDVVVHDRPVTWWETLPSHRAATPAELATVLRALHALPTPDDLSLPLYDPFCGLGQCADTAPSLSDSERSWLKQQITRLRAQYRETSNPKLIHGDAWQGNVAVTESGMAILLDLETVSLGRQHWDLVQVAADFTDFARISVSDYESFVEAYGGFDVAHLSDYRTLADIAELRWTCFALKKAATSTAAAREVRHRLECLRGEHPRPWAWNAL
jgi:aminoglycoside phosphotransferase (APT) family kinase protein